MLTLSTTQIWVRDQDEAASFWTDKVGFEIKEYVPFAVLGIFRWLTVLPKCQDGTAIVLMAIPCPPVMAHSPTVQV